MGEWATGCGLHPQWLVALGSTDHPKPGLLRKLPAIVVIARVVRGLLMLSIIMKCLAALFARDGDRPVPAASRHQAEALIGPDVGTCGPTEYHVFGVYEAPPDPSGGGGGGVQIFLDRPGKHVVVVSAYKQTTWHFNVSNGAILEKVYAVGYSNQTVDVSQVPNAVKVETDSEDTTGAYGCGYSWPYDGKGCDTGNMLRLASARVGHEFNSYDGCQSTGTITLDEHMHAYSDCTTSYEKLPANHFIVDCGGETEGSCGYEGGGEGSGSNSGGGGGSDGSGSDGGGDGIY